MSATDDNVIIKKSAKAADLPQWIFLRDLVKELGPEGTSSDEEDYDEGTMQKRFKTKRLLWRRPMDIHMAHIDKSYASLQAAQNAPGLFPANRIMSNSESTRAIPKGLPSNLYDRAFLEEKGQGYVDRFIDPRKNTFTWLEAS